MENNNPLVGFTFGSSASATGLKYSFGTAEKPSTVNEDSCPVSKSDEKGDVVLEVEGRQLHANRAVLAHYSPVFGKQLSAPLEGQTLRLPGQKYDEVTKFLEVMYPEKADAPNVIKDEDLVPLLTLAEEYQTDQVKARCQNYIAEQLIVMQRTYSNSINFHGSFSSSICTYDRANLISQLTLFLSICDQYKLTRFREDVKRHLLSLVQNLDDLAKCRGEHYGSLPLESKVDLLEELCRKLEKLAAGKSCAEPAPASAMKAATALQNPVKSSGFNFGLGASKPL